ncbi:MAG: putative selenate reductase subunit YgfK, partial [Bacteroidales bacterium]|nr:putative selenate reductase subunit YgfK [Bacteroidales bacterium]
DNFRIKRFGRLLESPFGVAAGPHTQLAQNIVAAWLTGARFIELKTIQTLDELDVSKPCIDMQDEGYNCEWSQELKIHESFDQYLDAWIVIHILKDKLKIGDPVEPGFIFNMSVGYNLDGILQENVQWFFTKMADASVALDQKLQSIKEIYPRVSELTISPEISDNITLSTMHGCPPDEIEKIGEYLINTKKLHTAVKLNPTLLGKESLREIMKNSGFDTVVPDIAFEHDLKYPDALKIIRNLQSLAENNDLQFSLKLTNTLESLNHKSVFDDSQEMMYMSGRALHAISVNLARKLQNEFNGQLDISFSGGANAFNIAGLTKSGLSPVTVCTDLLKPGGYGRTNQYLDELKNVDLSLNKLEQLKVLNFYADSLNQNPDYRKTQIHDPDIKTNLPLGFFDCTHAPCEHTCPTNQGIPDYMFYTSRGELASAAEVITNTNPFPNTTGMVCDHLCQTKCTRINLDSPLLIREVKRVVAENAVERTLQNPPNLIHSKSAKVAIIGAGPSGLSSAYFLAKAGFEVAIYEAKSSPGGMVSGAIPSFRLTNDAFKSDVQRIAALGVKVHYNAVVDKAMFEKLRSENQYLYIAAGAQKSKPLILQGSDAKGVLDPLDFLFAVKSGNPTGLGKDVLIIGGGNTAMDAARTAYRLVGENGRVRIAYRRTIKDMPADQGEINAVIEEGVEIIELVAPVKIITEKNAVKSVIFRKMKTGEKDHSGRARPVEIPESDFEIFADTVIPAIGQDLAIDFLDLRRISKSGSYETNISGVFMGGDALRGASTAINAIGDGRKAAQEIINKAGIDFQTKSQNQRPEKNFRQHIIDKSKRIKPIHITETALSDRKNFKLVQSPLTIEEGIEEAGRCLLCDEVCSVCTTVCPNLALITYEVNPKSYSLQKLIVLNGKDSITEDEKFEVKQKYQILHLADWCNQCGNCTTFCPTSGEPYLDKPHLFLNKAYYDNSEEGFYFENDELTAKANGAIYKFSESEKGFYFKNPKVEIQLNRDLKIIDYKILTTENFEMDLKFAAQMRIILEGAKQMQC